MRLGRDPAIGRLTRRPQFIAAASGRRFHSRNLSLQIRPRDEAEASGGLRVGLTVTKRVGHATERNRIRRRLRRAVAEAGAPFRVEAVDVVVIGRRDILTVAFDDLVADLTRGLRTIAKVKSRGFTPTSSRHGDTGTPVET